MSASRQMPLLRQLLLLALVSLAAAGSYEEVLEEDAADVTVIEKNAAAFVRELEHSTGGKKLTQHQVHNEVYGHRLDHIREVEAGHDGQAKIAMMRSWVKMVAPVLGIGDTHSQEGPLHLVLDTASEILGIPHEAGTHAHVQAKEVIIGLRLFTEAIIDYYDKRGYDGKDEL